MSYKEHIERGVELLLLCQRLQSEKDGVERPDPGSFDKTKTLDQFAMDIDQSISYMLSLYKLMPIQSMLSELGEELRRQGKVAMDPGSSFAMAALDYFQEQYGLKTTTQQPEDDHSSTPRR